MLYQGKFGNLNRSVHSIVNFTMVLHRRMPLNSFMFLNIINQGTIGPSLVGNSCTVTLCVVFLSDPIFLFVLGYISNDNAIHVNYVHIYMIILVTIVLYIALLH